MNIVCDFLHRERERKRDMQKQRGTETETDGDRQTIITLLKNKFTLKNY